MTDQPPLPDWLQWFQRGDPTPARNPLTFEERVANGFVLLSLSLRALEAENERLKQRLLKLEQPAPSVSTEQERETW